MKPFVLILFTLIAVSAHAADDPTVIVGDDAKYLFDLATDSSNPSINPDKVDFLGGCFFTMKNLVLTRLFCEFSEGRINSPDRLLKIVQPYLAFAPFPGVGDPDNGVEGRALGIEYTCERIRSVTHPSLAPKFTCALKDHYYRPRE